MTEFVRIIIIIITILIISSIAMMPPSELWRILWRGRFSLTRAFCQELYLNLIFTFKLGGEKERGVIHANLTFD